MIVSNTYNPKTHQRDIVVSCPQCHTERTVSVPAIGYRDWQKGMVIQVAMPDVDINTREALITGICAACWPTPEREALETN